MSEKEINNLLQQAAPPRVEAMSIRGMAQGRVMEIQESVTVSQNYSDWQKQNLGLKDSSWTERSALVFAPGDREWTLHKPLSTPADFNIGRGVNWEKYETRLMGDSTYYRLRNETSAQAGVDGWQVIMGNRNMPEDVFNGAVPNSSKYQFGIDNDGRSVFRLAPTDSQSPLEAKLTFSGPEAFTILDGQITHVGQADIKANNVPTFAFPTIGTPGAAAPLQEGTVHVSNIYSAPETRMNLFARFTLDDNNMTIDDRGFTLSGGRISSGNFFNYSKYITEPTPGTNIEERRHWVTLGIGGGLREFKPSATSIDVFEEEVAGRADSIRKYKYSTTAMFSPVFT